MNIRVFCKRIGIITLALILLALWFVRQQKSLQELRPWTDPISGLDNGAVSVSACIDDARGLVVICRAPGDTLYETGDSGETWNAVDLPLAQDTRLSYHIKSFQLLENNALMAVDVYEDGDLRSPSLSLYADTRVSDGLTVWNIGSPNDFLGDLRRMRLWNKEHIDASYLYSKNLTEEMHTSHGQGIGIVEENGQNAWSLRFDSLHTTLYREMVYHSDEKLKVLNLSLNSDIWVKITSGVDFDLLMKVKIPAGTEQYVTLNEYPVGAIFVYIVADTDQPGAVEIMKQ